VTTTALTAWAKVALKLHTVTLRLVRLGGDPGREQVGARYQEGGGDLA
jgi:hypothetical protein